jgi:hypothetical protein
MARVLHASQGGVLGVRRASVQGGPRSATMRPRSTRGEQMNFKEQVISERGSDRATALLGQGLVALAVVVMLIWL